MSNVEALFAQIASADPMGGKGSYLPKGLYRVKIQRVFMKDIRSGATPLICDYEVTASDHPEHPPGSNRNWYVALGTSDEQKMGIADIKSFLLSVTGIDYRAEGVKAAIDAACPALWRAVVSSANPLSGLEMGLEMVPYVTKKAGKAITLHKWLPGPAPMKVQDIMSKSAGSPMYTEKWEPSAANTAAIAAPGAWVPAVLPPVPGAPVAVKHALAGTLSSDGRFVLSDAGAWVPR